MDSNDSLCFEVWSMCKLRAKLNAADYRGKLATESLAVWRRQRVQSRFTITVTSHPLTDCTPSNQGFSSRASEFSIFDQPPQAARYKPLSHTQNFPVRAILSKLPYTRSLYQQNIRRGQKVRTLKRSKAERGKCGNGQREEKGAHNRKYNASEEGQNRWRSK